MVLLRSFNCVEYPVVFLALNRLGVVCSPSSPHFNATELANHIELVKVRSTIRYCMLVRLGR